MFVCYYFLYFFTGLLEVYKNIDPIKFNNTLLIFLYLQNTLTVFNHVSTMILQKNSIFPIHNRKRIKTNHFSNQLSQIIKNGSFFKKFSG
jgi:hypothetical protein